MICPKCKTGNLQWGNFCSNCGAALKEKCPECGKMEWIGRKICLTALEKAEKTKEEFFGKNGLSADKRGWIFFLIPMIGSVIWLIGLLIFTSSWFPVSWKLFLEAHEGLGFFIFLAVVFMPMFIYFFIATALWERKEKKLEKEFLVQYPAEVELLEKAEEK